MHIFLIAGLLSLVLPLLGGWWMGRVLKHPSLPRPETALPSLIIIVSLAPIAIPTIEDFVDGIQGLQAISSHSDEYSAYALRMAYLCTYAYGLIMTVVMASAATGIYTIPRKTAYTSLAPYLPIPLMFMYTTCSSVYHDLYIQYNPTTYKTYIRSTPTIRGGDPFSDLAVGAPDLLLYFLSVLSTLFVLSLSYSINLHRPQVSDTEVILVGTGLVLLVMALLFAARFVFGIL